jgi:MFS family permease
VTRASTPAAGPESTHRRIAISAGSLAVLLGALDTYVVVTIMTDIMRDVGIGVNQLQRITPIITGYLLGYVAAMPLLGRASDRFGRKMLIQVGLAGFALGSVVTALSTDVTVLVIGRFIQGAASGALLPVTLALAAELWVGRSRTAVLGGVSAAQELGSVLGPVYGIAVVALFHNWRAVFWINIPLAVITMVMIHFSLPGRQKTVDRQKVDVVGGLLLAVALGLAVVGLYNPTPDGIQVLPAWGVPTLIAAAVAAAGFVVWQRFTRTPLLKPTAGRLRPFLAALAQDQNQAAFLLLRFLIALPVGALLGGWLATRLGDRAVTVTGLLVAAGGFLLISRWTVDVLTTHHDLGLFSLPTLDTDLAVAGFGLGLVIGPLTSATLRVFPAVQHGIAAAAVVIARMVGMLLGVATLSAWGLYRFNQHLASLPASADEGTLAERVEAELGRLQEAYVVQYGEIFLLTAIVCVVGAALGLLISSRDEHA